MTAITHLKQGSYGVSTGGSHLSLLDGEEEIRQGGAPMAHLLASGMQVAQILSLRFFASPLVALSSAAHPWIRTIVNLGVVLSGGALLALGGLRGGFLSRTILGERAISVLFFVSRHAGKALYGAMLVTSIALLSLGHPFLGAGSLLMLSYGLVKNRLPERIQDFVGTYFPVLGLLTACLSGNPFAIVVNGIILLSYSSKIHKFLLYRMDQLVRRLIPLIPGHSLKEYESSLRTERNPSFATLQRVLEHPERLVINPAHYTKFPVPERALPQDRNFQRFLQLYDQIPWAERMEIVAPKIDRDDRFIDHLSDFFPQVNPDRIRQNVLHYVQILAGRQRISTDQYKLNWMRQQMQVLISHLCGQTPMAGSIAQIREARDGAATILAYLQRPDVNQVTREDSLLILAVEGGGYCARGVLRATQELIYGIHGNGAENLEPVRNYEIRMKQELYTLRRQILEQTTQFLHQQMRALQNRPIQIRVIRKSWIGRVYQNILQKITRLMAQGTADIHIHSQFRAHLALGYLPRTARERKELTFGELIAWWTRYAAIQQLFMRPRYQQRISEAFHALGAVHLTPYLLQVIRANRNLTDVQKDGLEEELIDPNSRFWRHDRGLLNGAQRFALYTMGILQ